RVLFRSQRAPGEPGVALPGPLSAQAQRLDRVGLEDHREQPPRALLLAHGGGAQAARRGTPQLAAPRARRRSRHAIVRAVGSTYEEEGLSVGASVDITSRVAAEDTNCSNDGSNG